MISSHRIKHAVKENLKVESINSSDGNDFMGIKTSSSRQQIDPFVQDNSSVLQEFLQKIQDTCNKSDISATDFD